MSRNVLIMMAVLGAGIAALIVLPKFRSHDTAPSAQVDPTTPPTPPAAPPEVVTPVAPSPGTAPTVALNANPETSRTVGPLSPGMQQVPKLTPAPGPGGVVVADAETDPEAAPKPLPELEKNYLATTNHEERLDILMDIADTPSAESIKALTRLFTAEADPELKIDLLDSLLAIDGFKDEKLELLKLGVRAGLPLEVRQSAIDGLIDLDDPRVVSVFNGLLNDPDEEIRETAKDAIEMLQPEVPVKR